MDGSARLDEFLRKIEEGSESIMDIARATDGSTTISFGRRELQPEQPSQPVLLRSPRRGHVFHDANAFKKYLAGNGSDGTVVLANAKDLRMSAVINEQKEDGLEVVHLQPTPHPAFQPWADLLNSETVDVNAFALLVMKHRRTVKNPEGRELALLFSQIRAESKVTIERGAGKSAINGVMVETKIAGSETTKGLVEIPDSISIETPIFIGGNSYEIEIDLLVSVHRNDMVTVSATSSQVQVVLLEEFDRMVKEVGEGSPFIVGLGEVVHLDWKTVS